MQRTATPARGTATRLALTALLALCLTAGVAACTKKNQALEALEQFRQEVCSEMNYARTKPAEYAEKFIKPNIARSRLIPGKSTSYAQSCYDQMRTMAPIGALTLSTRYSMASQWFAEDHRKTRTMGHVGSDKSRFWERVKRYEPTAHPTNECCAYGASGAREVVVMWLIDEGVTSLGHRKAVLNQQANVVGVGKAEGKDLESMYGVVVVADFGYQE